MKPLQSPVNWICLLMVFLFFCGGCASISQKPDVHRARRQEIVAIAVKYKGTPYQWGGTTPDGFDCAGYVQFVFRQAGLEIPRTSGRQFDTGDKIGRNNLRKGDLVFFTKLGLFNSLQSPNHVGIYIGGGRFIHAPSSGKCVRIDSLDHDYWQSHYKGARNLLY